MRITGEDGEHHVESRRIDHRWSLQHDAEIDCSGHVGRVLGQYGVTQVGERIWLVTFMQYDLGYFDDETCRLEPIENPFGAKCYPSDQNGPGEFGGAARI